MLLKEDNLGLGAKAAKADDQNFGLFALQDIYGRLNGKSETQLGKEQVHRADLGRKLYAEQRWGPSRFVRGGFLVGDTIEDTPPVAAIQVGHEDAAANLIEPNILRAPARSDPRGVESVREKEQKKPRKSTKRMKDPDEEDATVNEKSSSGMQPHLSLPVMEKETKEERRKRREERRQRKANKQAQRRSDNSIVTNPIVEVGQIQRSTAANANQSFDSRISVRQRFIKQKRMSSMDPQALREV